MGRFYNSIRQLFVDSDGRQPTFTYAIGHAVTNSDSIGITASRRGADDDADSRGRTAR